MFVSKKIVGKKNILVRILRPLINLAPLIELI